MKAKDKKTTRTELEPSWYLNDNWGVGTNTYNWVLLRKSQSTKKAAGGKWTPVGYYKSAPDLLMGLRNKMERQHGPEKTIAEQAERVAERVQAIGSALHAELMGKDWPHLFWRLGGSHAPKQGDDV